eukprot:10281007-Alexandrium_andersonii.AAC.1
MSPTGGPPFGTSAPIGGAIKAVRGPPCMRLALHRRESSRTSPGMPVRIGQAVSPRPRQIRAGP